MTCQDRNLDLLLHTHGELSGARRALLEWHLRRCPRCREQKRAYGAMSTVIAGEVRTPQMPPWTPRSLTPYTPPEDVGPRLGLCIALAVLLGVAGTAGVVWVPRSWWCPSRFMGTRAAPANTPTTTGARLPANLPANTPTAGLNMYPTCDSNAPAKK